MKPSSFLMQASGYSLRARNELGKCEEFLPGMLAA